MMKRTLLCLTLLTAMSTLTAAPALPAGETVPRAQVELTVRNATAFLRTQRQPDGGFGTVQPQLTTAAGVLALLCLHTPPAPTDRELVAGAVKRLVDGGTRRGDLGDREFKTESHALAVVALLAALPVLEDEQLERAAAERAYRAVRLLQRWQDRSSISRSRGGWKMEGSEGRENDRRASTWALYALYTAQAYGLDVNSANLERGRNFVLGAYKDAATDSDQAGGFSVDAEGLAVPSISAMGGWVFARLTDHDERGVATRSWLRRHPPAWTGPNWFYTNFFRLRALHLGAGPRADAEDGLRRVYLQVREHQRADGAVAFPPGNAQNTVAMGPAFSTAFAILALRADDSRLVADQDFTVRPPFPVDASATPAGD